MMANLLPRLHQLQARIQKKADALLVSAPADIIYLSGFSGEGVLFLLPDQPGVIITDGRYIFQAQTEAPHCQVLVTGVGQSMASLLGEHCAGHTWQRLGIQKEHLSVRQLEDIQKKLPDCVTYVAIDEGMSACREIKDEVEIAKITQACRIADTAFAAFLSQDVTGCSERELRLRLEQNLYCAGAEALAFDTIVASGPNAANPHAVSSSRQVREGDVLLLDFGAVYQGYHSDISRTLFVGQVSSQTEVAFAAVLEAKEFAAQGIKAGLFCREADALARTKLRESGRDKDFLHGLGHGVGLEIHEAPRLSAGAGDAILQEGSVITIEPGIYLAGEYGIRIEDTYLVEKSNCRALTLSQCGPFVVK
jgi:Xaa-Pro aminopeptidase